MIIFITYSHTHKYRRLKVALNSVKRALRGRKRKEARNMGSNSDQFVKKIIMTMESTDTSALTSMPAFCGNF